MTIKLSIVITLCALLTAACGGAGGGSSSFAIKTGGKDVTMVPKSSNADQSVMTYTEKPTGDGVIRSKKGGSVSFEFVNFEAKSLADYKLTADGQMRVRFSVVGEENTDQKTPIKIGTYTTDAEKFMRLNNIDVVTFVDGKEKSDYYSMMSGSATAKGSLKINSVTDDSVSGEIDVVDGERSIKGSFMAKLPKK